MTGPDPAWDPWTDQSYLRESQYKTDLNLAAQLVRAYQEMINGSPSTPEAML